MPLRAGSRPALDILTLSLVLAAFIILRDALSVASNPVDLLAQYRFDAAMRLVFAREWLQGDGWFDTTIDRMAPPTGTSLHWSRYADAPLIGLQIAFSWFVPASTAEGLAIVVWPTLLLAAFLLVTTLSAYRFFGREGAAIATLAVVLWESIARFRFGALNIDHHGLQMLLLLVVIVAVSQPLANARNGVLAGGVAGFSLAIGLETLVPIALAGVFLAARCIWNPQIHARILRAFGVSLPVSSLAFFVMQTPTGEWFLDRCDELSVAPLALIVASGTAAVVVAAAATRVTEFNTRLSVAMGIGAFACAVSLPFLGPCFDGPYGNLPPDIRDNISTIPEARSILGFLIDNFRPSVFFFTVIPIMTTISLATFFLFKPSSPARHTADVRTPATTLLFFAISGTAASLLQLRFIAMTETVAPLVMGYVGACLAHKLRETGSLRAGFLSLTAIVAMVAPSQLYLLAAPVFRPAVAASATESEFIHQKRCRAQADIFRSLNKLPESTLMAHGNFSQPILLLTHHSVVSAPYHRGREVMTNLTLFSEPDAEMFRNRLSASQSDYVVLCRNALYVTPRTMATRLASGEDLPGFTPVEDIDPRLVVLKVEHARGD
ncbi:MAG: hypothetical protein AAF762_02270 [Pseudomonadota bacterium]